MNPFDLAGPSFLALWVIGAVVAMIVMTSVRAALTRRSVAEAPRLARELDPYELAYLAGGIERAVEAAVVGLHHRGAIDATGGVITRKANIVGHIPDGAFRGILSSEALHPLERLVLGHSGWTVGETVRAAAHLEADLAASAQANELVPERPRIGRFSVALAGIAWTLFGFVKVCVGIDRGRPIGVLVCLLLVWAVCVLLFAKLPRLTTLGETVLSHAKDRLAGLEATFASAPVQLTGEEAVLAYGLFGHTALSLAGTAALLTMLPSYTRTMGSSGSSCSGGGCGGGGCSGCGGGCGGCS